MTSAQTRHLAAIALLSAVVPVTVRAQTTFTLVGAPGSSVTGISADGSTLFGSQSLSSSVYHPFIWSASAPSSGTDLGLIPPATSASASASSADGAIIVGNDNNNVPFLAGRSVPFIWRAGVGLTAGPMGNRFLGLNSAGTVAVGDVGWTTAALWTGINTGTPDPAIQLPVIASNAYNHAQAISADGSVIAGTAPDASNEISTAARWVGGVAAPNFGLVSGRPSLEANAVSPDGHTIVGSVGVGDFFGGQAEAVRWVDGVGTGLGRLPNQLASTAVSLSADASVIVGYHYNQPYNHTPTLGFVWTASGGMLDLRTLLTLNGVFVPGGTLTAVTGISADGRTLVGNGIFSGARQGWIVRLAPGALDTLLLLDPANNATALPEPVTLRWTSAPAATSYVVTIQLGASAPVQLSTTQTAINLPFDPTRGCATITWGVIAQTPSGLFTSRPASRILHTLRPADFDHSGTVDQSDLFSFLNAWFAGDPRTDVDGGGLAISDIFAYINLWFETCP